MVLPGLLSGLLLAVGCASAPAPALRTEVEALRAQVARMQQQSAVLEEQISGRPPSATSTGVPATEVAALQARIDSLEGTLAALRQRVDDMMERMNALTQDLSSTRELALRAQPPRTAPSQPPVGDGEGAPAASEDSEEGEGEHPPLSPAALEDTYNAAYADFSKGSYPLAIAGFQDFLKRYPRSELADNAQYWIGESYFAQGEFESAARQYDEVIQKYPKGDKVPAALLKKGLCFIEMNRTPEGVVLLQHLIQTYPASEEAALARDRLQGMGLRP